MRDSGEFAAVEAGEQTAEDEAENKTGVFMAACYQSGSLGLACFDTQTAEVAAQTSLNACVCLFNSKFANTKLVQYLSASFLCESDQQNSLAFAGARNADTRGEQRPICIPIPATCKAPIQS